MIPKRQIWKWCERTILERFQYCCVAVGQKSVNQYGDVLEIY